jgi:preprotein translocase SecE subunit
VARNRKRAKERRARRPQAVATARTERDEAPSPIVHATPDVEIAEAQLALGRPELAEPDEPLPEPEEPEESEPDLDALEPEPAAGGGGRGGIRVRPGYDRGEGDGAAPLPAARPRTGSRLINFLQGSWRELQRVQWPDRRQVVQATGVVIGFVIIAGIFLGVADTLAGHIMNYILNGHW